MTKLKLLLSASVLLCATLASPMSSARDYYLTTGEIYSLTNRQINVGDLLFTLSPTVKIRLEQGKKGRLSDLKVGDYVGINTIELGKKSLVDRIHKVEKPANL